MDEDTGTLQSQTQEVEGGGLQSSKEHFDPPASTREAAKLCCPEVGRFEASVVWRLESVYMFFF